MALKFILANDSRIIIGGHFVNVKANGTVIESDDQLDKYNSLFKKIDDKTNASLPKTLKKFSDIK